MDRRRFLKNGGLIAASWAAAHGIEPSRLSGKLLAAENGNDEGNSNWADPERGATARASSYVENPTGPPGNFSLATSVLGETLELGWETETETARAWLEITFPEACVVRELWILAKPIPYEIVLDPYRRGEVTSTPRRIKYSLAGGPSFQGELRQGKYFQILTLPQDAKSKSLRIEVEETWKEPGTQGTGLGKVRVYSRPHEPSFSITAYNMYDVHEGRPVQSATVEIVNPENEIAGASLQVSQAGAVLMNVPLESIPAHAVSKQNTWIPAPFEDAVMEFKILSPGSPYKVTRSLRVPAYRSYFDGGTFNILLTNHNDLGWLDTQAKTADYRSAELILPAMKLLKEYPEFRYSMESVIYLQEFLERHPEKRAEMVQYMRERRFTWGASYVQCQEVHVGPEKLVRQFYLGRRWLRKEFPGVDTHFYVKSDPENLTWQMPQILARAGVKYLIQGRLTFGFYNWEAPDGSMVLTYGYGYGQTEMNAKSNHGWLQFAADREYYFAPRGLPKIFPEDYTTDYLPPQGELLPYAREQNEAMKRFAQKWNEHFAGHPERQINPPRITFAEAEGFLDEFTKLAPNVQTLKGDWPFPWAYYDDPGQRKGLLAGREAHNRILAAERFYAPLSHFAGFGAYPEKDFAAAWQANCWPDHGWGGNRGPLTDAVYVQTYLKSKDLADKLLGEVASKAAALVPKGSGPQVPLVVFNPVSWTRSDVVTSRFELPSGWQSFVLRDGAGQAVPHQIVGPSSGRSIEMIFLAEAVPSVGYRTYYLEPSSSPPSPDKQLAGDTMENDYLRVVLGDGGLKSLYDKRLKQEILRTDKIAGGEVLQFTAPGWGWGDKEIVTVEDFDKTSNHPFPVKSFTEGLVSTTAFREAAFKHFVLKEHFRLYRQIDRVEIDLELVNWDGEKARELRVAFPINLDSARTSYEVPFGTVEMGKDELDFSLLPSGFKSGFSPSYNGAEHPLTFREAINWIDASAENYQSFGCLAAADCTVHLFKDESPYPVSYPVLQHVLISTRLSQAWNPDYWLTQPGNHRFRMALYPHKGDWRLRYRDGIAFNFPLLAFVAPEGGGVGGPSLLPTASFLNLEPPNLILTALKKAEDDEGVVVRFYEAEGCQVHANLRLFHPIKQAWKTNLIEDEEQPLTPSGDGSIQFLVKPWEIVTLKVVV
jgi:alpha-mannosidase